MRDVGAVLGLLGDIENGKLQDKRAEVERLVTLLGVELGRAVTSADVLALALNLQLTVSGLVTIAAGLPAPPNVSTRVAALLASVKQSGPYSLVEFLEGKGTVLEYLEAVREPKSNPGARRVRRLRRPG